MHPIIEVPRLVVHQNLTIERVRRRRAVLRVRLRHPGGMKDWITYALPAGARRECLDRLLMWRKRSTRLTYICGNGEGVLIDDRAFFDAAFASD
ncbi:MAG: hypothetical protein JWN62_408 [Acidimicrobiales bacterium]|nr:hypothetical protein [Acidimicrobiales bacterium]